MSKITKAEQMFLDTYMSKINRVWAEWFYGQKTGGYGKMSMKQREEILGLLRDKLHRIQNKLNS